MPQYQVFNNQQVLEPGAYSRILGGTPVPPPGITSGKVMILDTGIGAGYGGGSGSLGTQFQGIKSIYEFFELDDFRTWVRGGLLWDIARRIFKPSKSPNVNGCSSLVILQAKETTPATVTLSFTNGTVVLGCYAEGSGANGVINSKSEDLQSGFAVKMAASALISGEYQFNFSVGTYLGVDENGADLNNISAQNAISQLIFVAETFVGIPDFVAYLQTNQDILNAGFYLSSFTVNPISPPVLTGGTPATSGGTFAAGTYFWVLTALNGAGETVVSNEVTGAIVANGTRTFTWPQVSGETGGYRLYRGTVSGAENHYFTIPHGTLTYTDTGTSGTAGTPPSQSTATGSGAFVSGDLTSLSSFQLFTGGTEDYSTNAFNEAIQDIQELDNVYFLCDKYGVTNGVDAEMTTLFTAVTTEGDYQRLMIMGGGNDRTEQSQLSASSAAMAAYYNSGYMFICHGEILEKNQGTTPGFRTLSPIYFAATVVGKMAGNAPQKPITWEDMDIDGAPQILKQSERNALLKQGVIHLKLLSSGQLAVNQEVTSLQQNTQYVYPNGQCPDGSLMRISCILNKTIKQRLEQRGVGSNQNLTSPADVQTFVETILLGVTATKTTDNLIISSQNVKVSLTGADYTISYGFYPNGPINRFFVTGFMFTPTNVTA